MLLHALQEHFGCISKEAIEWTAKKLEPAADQHLRTGHVLSDVPPGTGRQVSAQGCCRTLSCALGGSGKLHEHFCRKFGPGPAMPTDVQTTKDGKFSVEFVECLASCGTAPGHDVRNDEFYEGVRTQKADELLANATVSRTSMLENNPRQPGIGCPTWI